MFTKEDEGAIWRNDFNRYVWHPALRAVGVVPGRENGFHQLRHHYAARCCGTGWTSGRSPNTSATPTLASPSACTAT